MYAYDKSLWARHFLYIDLEYQDGDSQHTVFKALQQDFINYWGMVATCIFNMYLLC